MGRTRMLRTFGTSKREKSLSGKKQEKLKAEVAVAEVKKQQQKNKKTKNNNNNNNNKTDRQTDKQRRGIGCIRTGQTGGREGGGGLHVSPLNGFNLIDGWLSATVVDVRDFERDAHCHPLIFA